MGPMRCAVLLLTLAVAACGDDTPSCGAVADHIAAVAARTGGATMKVADRAELVRNCEAERGGNAAMRRCVMAADTLDAIKQCELRAALGR